LQKPRALTLPTQVVERCSHILHTAGVRSIDRIPHQVIFDELAKDVSDFLSHHDFARSFGKGETEGFIFVDCGLKAGLGLTESMVIGGALFDLVSRCFFEPTRDVKSGANFTLYKSTAENKAKMEQAGIKFYAPDEKLGFHNDVLHKAGKYAIPEYVSLMNLFLGYDSPGLFYYVDKRKWPDIASIVTRGAGRRFKFRPTPVVYASAMKNISALDEYSRVPVAWTGANGEPYVFCNGELVDSDSDSFIEDLKQSLIENEFRVASSQKTFRIMLLRNDIGFHSRDIMRDQVVLSGTTRLMLRSMSKQCVALPD